MEVGLREAVIVTGGNPITFPQVIDTRGAMTDIDHAFLRRHVLIAVIVGLLIVAAGEYGPLMNASSSTAAVPAIRLGDSNKFSDSHDEASIVQPAAIALWKLLYAAQEGALHVGIFVDTSVKNAAALLWCDDLLTMPIKNHRAHCTEYN